MHATSNTIRTLTGTVDTDLSNSCGITEWVSSLTHKCTMIILGNLSDAELTHPIIVVNHHIPLPLEALPVMVPLEGGLWDACEPALQVNDPTRRRLLGDQLLDHYWTLLVLGGHLADDLLGYLGGSVFVLHFDILWYFGDRGGDSSGFLCGDFLKGFWRLLQGDFNWCKLLRAFYFL